MQHLGVAQQYIPIEIGSIHVCEAGAQTVIHNFGCPQTCALRQKVKAHAAIAGLDVAAVNIMRANGRHGPATQRIVRNGTHYCCIMAQMGKANRDICLGSPYMHIKAMRLHQQFTPRGGQPDKQFSKKDDWLCHDAILAG
jgi:hypothetical protein